MSAEATGARDVDVASIYAIERPHKKLFNYYLITSFALGPLFLLLLLPRYFRFHTLRYRFDDEGISMRWGLLFRREINLTYSRIQDIHLTSNVIERYLGLARIEVQTASGSADAEMTLEGLEAHAEIRDFLYARMRGGAHHGASTARPAAAASASNGELAGVLREVAGELRALRAELAQRREAGEGR